MKAYFEHGQVRIYCADSLTMIDDLRQTVDSILYTDPPYGVGAKTARYSSGRSGLADSVDYTPIVGDDRPFDPSPWLTWERVALWGGNYYSHRLPPSDSWLIWDKRDSSRTTCDNADCELAWSNIGGPARIFSHTWKGMIRASEAGERHHPTMKPVALARWGLMQMRARSCVIDPFMGAGSTILAAMDLQLPVIGVEIEEKYCALAVERIRARSLDLALPRPKPVKRCGGCKRLLAVEVGITFNRHTHQPDGLQPFCRECDARQKAEPAKSWKRFLAALRQRQLGEERFWTEKIYFDKITVPTETGRSIARCRYCGGFLDTWSAGYWLDKVNPDDRYEPDNCHPCCWPCNRTKSNKSPETWQHTVIEYRNRYPGIPWPWDVIEPKRFAKLRDRGPDLRPYVVNESLQIDLPTRRP